MTISEMTELEEWWSGNRENIPTLLLAWLLLEIQAELKRRAETEREEHH